MLDTLRFVRGAVSNKDLVPVLTHFRISGGRLQGQNGRVALDAACPELAGLDLIVPADKFLRAVDACEGEPKITVKDDKLTVSRGRFRATMGILGMDQYPERTNDVSGGPGCFRVGAGLIETLRKAEPFMSADASRPWSCSVLLTDDVTFATNNVVLACIDYDWRSEDLVLPAFAVDELLRIGEDPETLSWDGAHFQANYRDGSWLVSQLIEGAWPGTLRDLHKMCVAEDEWLPMPGDMADALTKLKPFFPDAKIPVVVLAQDGVATQDGVSSALVGMDGLPPSAFRLESLSLVVSAARQWNPARYPKPVPWKGDGMIGMLSGVRL